MIAKGRRKGRALHMACADDIESMTALFADAGRFAEGLEDGRIITFRYDGDPLCIIACLRDATLPAHGLLLKLTDAGMAAYDSIARSHAAVPTASGRADYSHGASASNGGDAGASIGTATSNGGSADVHAIMTMLDGASIVGSGVLVVRLVGGDVAASIADDLDMAVGIGATEISPDGSQSQRTDAKPNPFAA